MDYGIPPLKIPNEGTFLDFAVDTVRRLGLADPDYTDPSERSLLFAGSPHSGKTTLINKYLFGTDQRLSTNSAKLLEYYCSPSSSWMTDDNYKNTCHVWELEDLTFEDSLQMVANSPRISGVLCLDLSQPQLLYHTQDTALRIFEEFAKKRKDFEGVRQETLSKAPKDHPDSAAFKLFPIPLVIIGMKYDLYHKFEPEKKRVISQFMRYLAHVNGAHLFYWTDRNSEIIKQAKAILRHYAYGKARSSVKKIDYNKAIFVPPFEDKLSEINPSGEHSISKYQKLLESHYPQENPIKSNLSKNPANDPIYAEPIIDLIREKAQASWRSNM